MQVICRTESETLHPSVAFLNNNQSKYINVNEVRYLGHERRIHAPYNSSELNCMIYKHAGFQTKEIGMGQYSQGRH